MTKYHFLVANAKFMLDDEEHFQELMRERLRNFAERNREQDFWLVVEPKFLENLPNIANRLKRPAVALVSTDELWITYVLYTPSYILIADFYNVTFPTRIVTWFSLLVRICLGGIMEIHGLCMKILFGPVAPLPVITPLFFDVLLIHLPIG